MNAIIDSAIRIPESEVPDEVWSGLRPMLALPNREKESARREKRYGWTEMPDEIELFDFQDGHLVIPRGFRDPLEQGCESLGVSLEWTDNRTNCREFKVWPAFDRYRSFQQPAARALLEAEEGIIEAPAGSGKSVTGMELVRIARQRWNIVVVNTINIATQWVREARKFLPASFGFGVIGEGRWDEQRLTVATVQTLYSRREELDEAGWWDKWGVALLDECHHQTARTFIEVMGRFSARIRGGMSATPDKTGDFDVAQAVLGDVVYRTTRHRLREEGILVRPTITVVDTQFSYPYWPTHDATRHTKYVCEKPGCALSGKRRHGHRNNYTKMIAALVRDRQRNVTIANYVMAERDRRQLLVSPQKGHLGEIYQILMEFGFDAPIMWLTGDASDEQRQEIVDRARSEDSYLMLATIADEALDVPPLEVLHMPFPGRNPGTKKQQIGRIERNDPRKRGAKAYDYRDPLIGVLANQFKTRRWEVYAPEMYQVEFNAREV